MSISETIRRKRDGLILNQEEIDTFIGGLVDDSVAPEQAAAFAMAVFFKGMSAEESATLTRAMTDSGEILSWDEDTLGGAVVDKHSTGGVGDKVSLILAPIAAACGLFVPMISGRGLGHTGGTLDKLESIKGYNVEPSVEHFRRVVAEAGCAIVGQTTEMAPADKRLYSIRDVTATVDSIPLITASILSKKLAAGISGLVMDVKVGSGAIMQSRDDATALARSLIDTATAAGLPTRALITDMNQILGTSVGNALEITEACDFLTDARPRDPRLAEIVTMLACQMQQLTDPEIDIDAGRKRVDKALTDGRAAEHFGLMVAGLGGPADFLERYAQNLPVAPVIVDVLSPKKGTLVEFDTRAVGLATIRLGGGRGHPDDTIDPRVGFDRFVSLGTKLAEGDRLCRIHAASAEEAEAAAEAILSGVTLSREDARQDMLIHETLC